MPPRPSLPTTHAHSAPVAQQPPLRLRGLSRLNSPRHVPPRPPIPLRHRRCPPLPSAEGTAEAYRYRSRLPPGKQHRLLSDSTCCQELAPSRRAAMPALAQWPPGRRAVPLLRRRAGGNPPLCRRWYRPAPPARATGTAWCLPWRRSFGGSREGRTSGRG